MLGARGNTVKKGKNRNNLTHIKHNISCANYRKFYPVDEFARYLFLPMLRAGNQQQRRRRKRAAPIKPNAKPPSANAEGSGTGCIPAWLDCIGISGDDGIYENCVGVYWPPILAVSTISTADELSPHIVPVDKSASIGRV